MYPEPSDPTAKKFTHSPFFQSLPKWIGAGVVLFGLLAAVSWIAQWQSVLEMLPGTVSMRFNTAVGFVLCGSGLMLLAMQRTRYVPLLGGAVMLLAALTLAEYVTGWELGIDQIVATPHFAAAMTYPGRMSPLATTCFLLTGLEILLAGSKKGRLARLAEAGLLPCVVLAIAAVAVAGYVFQIEPAYGWGTFSQMAVNTAVTFMVLSTGLMLQAWRTAKDYSFRRWLPVTGAVTLMLMVALVSVVNMAELRSATAWRRHTYAVIDEAQSFENDFIGMQRNARGYVTLGTPELLAAYQTNTATWSTGFNHLVELTADNPAQQRHLKAISDAVQSATSYDDELIRAYQRSGPQGVMQMDATGRGRAASGHVLDGVKVFTAEEKDLLNERDDKEQSDYRCLENLLIFGNTLSAFLLIIANSMASRELVFRQRAEARLQALLALQKAILDSADYGIVATGLDGLVQTFNPAAARMLGYSPDEVVGRKTPMLWRDPQEVAARAQDLAKQSGKPVEADFTAIVGNVRTGAVDEGEWTFVRKDGSRFPCLLVVSALADGNKNLTGYLGVFRDISDRKKSESERELLIADLKHALAEVNTLSGLIPICGWCKSVRNDSGYWETVEKYVQAHTKADFTHGICPACQEKLTAGLK